MDQGRYQEALEAFDGAIEKESGVGGAHAGKAEVCLLQGIEPDKALAWAEKAIAIKQASWLKRNLDRACDAEYRADQAWALALLGRHAEARAAIETATRFMHPAFRPALAGVHWRIGMAEMAMQESDTARNHFRMAREIDPRGKYGVRAAQAESNAS
jgi:tetratricopeptide (TPR) repeat protein